MLIGSPRRAHDGESGAVLVLTSLLLVVLMGFAALAIDAGSAWSTKRQAQSATDFSAMAALQVIPRTFQADAEAVTRAEAEAFAAENAPGSTVTSVELSPTYEDVTITLELPSPNSFGQVIGGGGSLTTRASATGHLEIGLFDKLLPIAFQDPHSGSTGEPFQCVGEAPDGSAEPRVCRSSERGHLNEVLDMKTLTPPDCGSSLASNLSVGVDHLVDTIASGLRAESQACSLGHSLTMPTAADAVTADPATLTAGLIADSNAPMSTTSPPLWEFLRTGIGGQCDRSNYPAAKPLDEKSVDLRACLRGSPPKPLFVSGVIRSPRFGWGVDSVGELGGTLGLVEYDALVPMFLNTIVPADPSMADDPLTAQYLDAQSAHPPGLPMPPGTEIAAATVYSLEEDMLSESDRAALRKPNIDAIELELVD